MSSIQYTRRGAVDTQLDVFTRVKHREVNTLGHGRRRVPGRCQRASGAPSRRAARAARARPVFLCGARARSKPISVVNLHPLVAYEFRLRLLVLHVKVDQQLRYTCVHILPLNCGETPLASTVSPIHFSFAFVKKKFRHYREIFVEQNAFTAYRGKVLLHAFYDSASSGERTETRLHCAPFTRLTHSANGPSVALLCEDSGATLSTKSGV
ncbi:hypothetical protein EVAR_17020_1 [Eumeta japonica]|uniref:Uncharacterized protein n=1 Tax=Eumeta variegata TaxID=151549 RepID=A0A4C1TVK7_EUMVA|nr:hypothetical protein EVAR_17020_1 [Eumeta japonica]